MEQLFLTILNRAVTAGWLVLLVIYSATQMLAAERRNKNRLGKDRKSVV